MNLDEAITILRRLREALEARGVAHASLFGSIARNRGRPHSDVDVLIVPIAGRHLDLFDLGGIQAVLDEGFGCDVDLVVEPIRKLELRQAIAQDRADAF